MRRSLMTLVGASAVLLSACGFQLRGHQDYVFKHLMVVGAPAPMEARFTRMIEGGSDTRVVQSQSDADAILRLSMDRSQTTLTLDQYGTVAEYQLNYSVHYMVTGSDGTLLIPPSVITLNRAMTYNSQYANAKAQEADILFTDMENDAVDQITRRLSVVRTLRPAPGQGVPPINSRAPLPPPQL
jgi:LPS-assembly lipoprotein